MKNPEGIWISFFLLLIVLLVTGCSTISNMPSPDPPATSLPDTATIPATTLPSPPALLIANYKEGDMIQKSPTDPNYDQYTAWVILQVNENGTYKVGRTFYDREFRVWWKSSDELTQIKTFSVIERTYPELLGQMNWTDILTQYPYRDEGITKYGSFFKSSGLPDNPSCPEIQSWCSAHGGLYTRKEESYNWYRCECTNYSLPKPPLVY